MAKDSNERARYRLHKVRRRMERERYHHWRSFDLRFEPAHRNMTQEEFFELEERLDREEEQRLKKSLERGKYITGGLKGYKKPYKVIRRRQGKDICRHYLNGDDDRMESINQDDFMGDLDFWYFW